MESGYSAIQSKESAKKSHRYGLTCENKKQLVPSSMIFLSLFLILTSNTMMCAEANDISMNADTNKIVRSNAKAIRRAVTGKHINENETQRIDRGTSVRVHSKQLNVMKNPIFQQQSFP